MNTPTLPKNCLVCGNTFYKKSYLSRSKWGASKYCSVACSVTKTGVQTMQNPWLGKHMPDEVKKKISSSMMGHAPNSGCFKKGNIPPYKGVKNPKIAGDKHPNWKPHIEKPCAHCGKMMSIPQWNKQRRFCDAACWALGHRGANSPVYKGDRAYTPLRTRIMQLPEYVAWRANVFKRDGYACVLCHEKGYLEADHIKTYASIIKDHGVDSPEKARGCMELWDVRNGRTLCRMCHRKSDTHGLRSKKSI